MAKYTVGKSPRNWGERTPGVNQTYNYPGGVTYGRVGNSGSAKRTGSGWWNRATTLRGILGDDYGDMSDDELIAAWDEWMKSYGPNPYNHPRAGWAQIAREYSEPSDYMTFKDFIKQKQGGGGEGIQQSPMAGWASNLVTQRY